MAKKADLVKEAKALGVETDGLKVAELEAAIAEAQASQADEAPEAPPPTPGPVTRLADVVAAIEDGQVRLGFGHWVEQEFDEQGSHLIDPDEAVALADVLPDLARAALNNRRLG